MDVILEQKEEINLDAFRYEDIFMHKQNVLHLATEYSYDCLEVLLFTSLTNVRKHIIDEDHWNYTALHLSAQNSTTNCASIILDSVENVRDVLTIKDRHGNTPLHIVMQKLSD